MDLVQTIEQRLALPGDSETRRSQKVLGVGMMLGGCVLTLISALIHRLVGYSLAPLAFISLGTWLVIGALGLLKWPRLFEIGAWLTLIVTVLANVAGQLLTGGLASGTYDVIWAFVAILGAVLIMGWRVALAIVLVFALAIAASVFLNPLVAELALEVPVAARVSIGFYNLLFMAIYLAGATLLLIRVIESLRLRADNLLLNILPASIAARLKERPGTIADGHSEITVLFADIVDFTRMSSDADPAEVVGLLNDLFSEFDDLVRRRGLEKIKTIGDAYMVAAGLPEPRPDHAEQIVDLAQEMLDSAAGFEGFSGQPVRLRIGINTGPVVAGVIGRNKFIYDLWGDAVNVASRMESNGLTNEIQVTAAVKEKLDGRYAFTAREPLPIKGKGMMVTYLLAGRKGGEAQGRGSEGA
jgi:adenylate cyclase